MKSIFSYIFAGIIGGCAVLTGSKIFLKPSIDSSKEMKYSRQVNEAPSMTTIGPDFTVAADQALQVVVQINAQESQKLVRQKEMENQRNNPFFSNPYFKQFGFGGMFGQPMPMKGSGSGVIVSNDGYIVTNNHVVEFADEIEVILKNGKKYSAKKIGTDPKTDLAVLKIEESGLPVLVMGNSDQLRVGEWVLAVGNPFGYLTSTVTAGIVSAKGRDLNIIDQQQEENDFSQYFNPGQRQQSSKGIEEFIQTDAAVNPGNSGGALVDGQGRLVGINSAIASNTGYYSGYSFAIPVNLMNKIVKELISNGSFERGRLGIQISEIDEESMKSMNLSSKKGVIIESIEDNSSAKYAGLLPQDVIIGIDGKEINTPEELQKYIGLTKLNDTIKVKIIRSKEIKEISVKIRKGI